MKKKYDNIGEFPISIEVKPIVIKEGFSEDYIKKRFIEALKELDLI